MRNARQTVLFLAFLLVSSPVLAQETPPAADKPEPSTETTEEAPAEPTKESKPPVKEKAAEKIDLDEDIDLDADDDMDAGWDDEEAEPVFPRFEHHGYFRFRADMFGNLHLGTHFKNALNPYTTLGTSAFKPPLTENFINNDTPTFGVGEVGTGNDESILSGANMRFRYKPTIRISDSLSIHTTIDVLDNVVMGSTPDFHPLRPDVPIAAFSSAQVPPSEEFEVKDSVRVKELWGEWKLLGAPLRFGRMSSNWGLGMLSNDGNGWDDDYGDYYDRIMFSLQLYGIYIAGGYDIVSSGPTYQQPLQPFGQAYDITETDDVQQGFVAIFSRPIQQHELDARKNLLVRERKPAFDWGLYTVYRKQNLDLSTSSNLDTSRLYDDTQLVKREAWAIIPDVWLRMEYRPSYMQRLRLELEAAMIYGKIGHVPGATPEDDLGGERDLTSWGVAFEGEYTRGSLTFGLDAGAASGDSARGLTINDKNNFSQKEPKYDANGDRVVHENGDPAFTEVFNTKITNFKFDRNYHVDQILFREVIGSVTNAWYVKPYIQYDLFNAPDAAIGGRLDILYARALEPSAYPGESADLGLELDAKIFFASENKFYGDVTFGILFPGDAFALKDGYLGYSGSDRSPGIAWTLQSHLVMNF